MRLIDNFNPRTPRGVRRHTAVNSKRINVFQSTHPAMGATQFITDNLPTIIISIHAPREGCDGWRFDSSRWLQNFNPRTPRGVRLYTHKDGYTMHQDFNPRTPRGVRL